VVARRQFLTVAAATAVSLSGCVHRSTPADRQFSLEAYATAEWPRPNRTPTNNRFLESTSRDGEPTVSWRVETPAPVTALVIADDTLYAADSEGVTAVDAQGGEQVWHQPYSSGADRRLEAVAGRLYLSDRTHVRALEAADGNEEWTYETDAPVAELLEYGGVVYVAGQCGLHGVHAGTGEGLWSLEPATHSRLAAAEDTIYWLNALELVVLEPAGTQEAPHVSDRWRWGSSQLPTAPVVTDVVYAGRDGRAEPIPLRLFDPERSHRYPEQTRPIASRLGVPAVTADGRSIYVSGVESAGDPESGLIAAIDLTDGEEKWTRSIDGRVSNVICTDRLVYVSVNYGDGQLMALEREDGTDRWQQSVPVGDTGPPPLALVGDRLYYGTGEGVVAFD